MESYNDFIDKTNEFVYKTEKALLCIKKIDSKNTYDTIKFVFFLFWLEQQGKITKEELYNLFDKRS